MERSVLRIGFAVLLAMLTAAFVFTREKPEARRRFMDTLPIHVAFLLMLLGGAVDLSPAVHRATWVLVGVLVLVAFGRLLWSAKRL